MKKRFLLLLLPLLALLSTSLSAQVLVYKLKFEETGEAVNYESYDGGYFVVEGFSGIGTLVLTVQEGPYRFYTELGDSGEIFFVEDNDDRVAVFRAFGDDTQSATVAYQAIGEVEGSQKLGAGFAARIARKLEGFLLASAEDTDAIFDDDALLDEDGNEVSDPTQGFAGASEMEMRFDKGRTREANENFWDEDETVDQIIFDLFRRGYLPEPDDNQLYDPGDVPDPPTPPLPN